MRMTIVTPLLDLIREAHVEEIKEERRKSERIIEHISSFDNVIRGLLTLHNTVWSPYSG